MTAPLYQAFVEDELALAPALVARVLTGTLQLLGPSKESSASSAGDRTNHSDIVKSLPLIWLRWLVIIVIAYAAFAMLRSAARGEERASS